jgi:hypothetical protein
MTIDGSQAIHALPHPLAVLHDLTTDHDEHQRLRAMLTFLEGVVRALSNRADGTLFGQWYTLRGLSLRSGGVEVAGMERVPLHAVVLLDTTRARALTLGPFLLCEGASASR